MPEGTPKVIFDVKNSHVSIHIEYYRTLWWWTTPCCTLPGLSHFTAIYHRFKYSLIFLPKKMRNMRKMAKNVSLVLVDSHWGITFERYKCTCTCTWLVYMHDKLNHKVHHPLFHYQIITSNLWYIDLVKFMNCSMYRWLVNHKKHTPPFHELFCLGIYTSSSCNVHNVHK